MQFLVPTSCCSPDGKYVAIAVFHYIQIYDLHTGNQVGPDIKIHKDLITSIQFQADNVLVSGSCDSTIRMWDMNSETQIGEPFIRHVPMINYVKFVNSSFLASTIFANRQIHIWNRYSRTQVRCLECPATVHDIDCTPYKEILISGNYSCICLWNIVSGKRTTIKTIFETRTVKISSNNKLIASGREQGMMPKDDMAIRIWDRTSSKLINKLKLQDTLVNFQFSADGLVLTSTTEDKQYQIWNLPDRKNQIINQSNEEGIIEFLCDGRLIVSKQVGDTRLQFQTIKYSN